MAVTDVLSFERERRPTSIAGERSSSASVGSGVWVRRAEMRGGMGVWWVAACRCGVRWARRMK
jgi:hypothetical protein